MKLTIEKIDPSKARTYLAKNTGNFRPLHKATVARYADDMANGNWVQTGESIKFANGVLVDGQHRLAAIIESNTSIELAVAFDVNKGACYAIDSGRPRKISQWLSHIGIKNACIAGSVGRMALLHDDDKWSVTAGQHTPSQIIDYVVRHDTYIQDAIHSCSCLRGQLAGVSITIASTIAFLASDKKLSSSSETITWFMRALATGLELTKDQPVFHFRNKFIQQTNMKQMTHFMQRMVFTLAWNKTASGEACTTANGIRIILSGPSPQRLPTHVMLAPEFDYPPVS